MPSERRFIAELRTCQLNDGPDGRVRFQNKGGASSERAAIPGGKHGPSLRSIGLLASRARLVLELIHSVIPVKCPFRTPWSAKPDE